MKPKLYYKRNFLYKFSALSMAIFMSFLQVLNAKAVSPLVGTPQERVAAQQNMPIDTNEIENWPEGPVVSAESAILMDAGTGAILYSKNIHEK